MRSRVPTALVKKLKRGGGDKNGSNHQNALNASRHTGNSSEIETETIDHPANSDQLKIDEASIFLGIVMSVTEFCNKKFSFRMQKINFKSRTSERLFDIVC